MEVPSLTELVSSVPQIIITEPSPLAPIGTSIVQSANPNASDGTSATSQTPAPASTPVPPAGESSGGVVLDVKLDVVPRGSSDEFQPAADCTVSVEEKLLGVCMDVIDTNTEGSENEEVAEDEFRTSENAFSGIFRCLHNFSESKYMLLVQILLLAVPLSSGFMGAKYMDKCPMSTATPLFLFMMGVAGTITILCRMVNIVQKTVLPTHGEWRAVRSIIIFGDLIIVVFLSAEMCSFLRLSPSFESGAPNYCHEIIYTFTYWMNWLTIFLIAVLILFQVPNTVRQSSQAVDLS